VPLVDAGEVVGHLWSGEVQALVSVDLQVQRVGEVGDRRRVVRDAELVEAQVRFLEVADPVAGGLHGVQLGGHLRQFGPVELGEDGRGAGLPVRARRDPLSPSRIWTMLDEAGLTR
jgi:hypothetical protein